MIEKLQYVLHRRYHIALDVRIVARFLANPRENHMVEMKIILRYFKGVEYHDLWYKRSDEFELKFIQMLMRKR